VAQRVLRGEDIDKENLHVGADGDDDHSTESGGGGSDGNNNGTAAAAVAALPGCGGGKGAFSVDGTPEDPTARAAALLPLWQEARETAHQLWCVLYATLRTRGLYLYL
jgi:hypothetical protein